MQRRTFLKTTAPMAAVFPALLGGFNVKAYAGAPPFLGGWDGAADNDHVLVLVQLFGGNDGLNTVIPIDLYSSYTNLRNNIAIPEGSILKLGPNDKSGLHPAMTGLQALYNNDQLAILQGV